MDEKSSKSGIRRFDVARFDVARLDQPSAEQRLEALSVAATAGAVVLETKSLPPRGAEIVSLEPVRRFRASKAMRKPAPKALPKVPIEDHIGRQLKTIYDDVLAQPIPERFLELLQKLEARSGEGEDRT